jgi:hypothetical protein
VIIQINFDVPVDHKFCLIQINHNYYLDVFIFATMTWLTVMEYLCHKWLWICSTCRKHFPVLSSFSTYYRFVARLTRRVPLVEEELITLPEHLSSPPIFSGVHATWSLVLYICFVDRCLSFCTFSFGYCVVCSSSIYGFWLPLWYLQTLFIYLPTPHPHFS